MYRMQGGIYRAVTEFRGMALNGLFCADVLRPLDLVPLTDFTYKYHRDCMRRLLYNFISPT